DKTAIFVAQQILEQHAQRNRESIDARAAKRGERGRVETEDGVVGAVDGERRPAAERIERGHGRSRSVRTALERARLSQSHCRRMTCGDRLLIIYTTARTRVMRRRRTCSTTPHRPTRPRPSAAS